MAEVMTAVPGAFDFAVRLLPTRAECPRDRKTPHACGWRSVDLSPRGTAGGHRMVPVDSRPGRQARRRGETSSPVAGSVRLLRYAVGPRPNRGAPAGW